MTRRIDDVAARPDLPSGRAAADRGDDLRGRLAELASSHPSAAGYLRHREQFASDTVERVGHGVVDERACSFQPRERRLADHLAGEGRTVVAIHDAHGRAGRRPDAAVDGVETEFKSLDAGASNRTVKAALNSAKGQARAAVIDGRDSGLERPDADLGIRRFLGTPYEGRLDAIRVIGDGYDLTWERR
ncbi:MAG TPA: hypothetical protein VGI58_09640 [Streptosporangiaceae bacterium]|jgi:hypothetical protein